MVGVGLLKEIDGHIEGGDGVFSFIFCKDGIPRRAHTDATIFVGVGKWRSVDVVSDGVPTHVGISLHDGASVIDGVFDKKPELMSWRRGKCEGLMDGDLVIVKDGMDSAFA